METDTNLSKDIIMTIALEVVGKVLRSNRISDKLSEKIELEFDAEFEKCLDATERDRYERNRYLWRKDKS